MNTHTIRLLLFVLVEMVGSSAHADIINPCAEAYFESVHINRVNTQTGFLSTKVGYCFEALQLGIVTRTGADTRTALDSSNAIFNDNYFFIGAGASLANAFPGVRLLAEAGYSFDLNSKLHKRGNDYRAGWMSYHETLLPSFPISGEFYSEGLYVHRYRNYLLSLQPRLFWGIIKLSENLPLGPLVGLNISYDSANYDYNRFVEVNYGLKAKWFPSANTVESGFSLGAQVYGVRGFRTNKETNLPAYNDFRVLFFGYFSISATHKDDRS